MEVQASDRRWLALGVLCLSLVLVVVDNTILNVALPTLGRALDASTSDLQWMVDSYILVFAGLLLTAGSLGDRFGRRRALTAGLVVFGVASIASAFAGSSAQLIATRALMGVGAAFVMPSTLSIISNLFTDPAERARAIAIWAGCAGLGVAIGPMSGGALLAHFWWGSVFLVNVPVIALALIGGRLLLPESSDPDEAKVDAPGAVLSVAGLALLIWSLIEAGHDGWTEPKVLAGLAIGTAVVGAFAWWERRTANPMLDLTFFSNRRFTAATGSITVMMFAMFGSFFLLTQLLQLVLGYSALEAGVRMLPFAVTMAAVAPVSARLVERVGTKAIVATGMAVAGFGLLLITAIDPGDGYAPVALAMFVQAAGMALVFAPATESIMGSLPAAKAGVGSAVNDTTREIGGALGVAVLGSVLSSSFAAHMSDAGAPTVARTSLGAALAVARTLPDAAGTQLAAVARDAFVDSIGLTLVIAAGVAFAGAIMAALLLPSRAAVDAEARELDFDDELFPALDAA